jgi:tetrahedral aminopeptidase
MSSLFAMCDELAVSPLGSLHALRRGKGNDPRPRILLTAHMDAIGLMVTGVVNGLLRITQVGGVDSRILPGQPVMVHGRRALPGIVMQPSDRLLPHHLQGNPVSRDRLFVDTGLPAKELAELVRVGDLVSFDTQPVELSGETLSGHSLDNRASVAALTVCLQELQHITHIWDVWVAATSQEEESLGGAFTSPFTIRPDIAVAVDVTFAKGPGSSDYRTFALGKGPTLGWGPNVHPAIYKRFKEISEKLDLPHQTEVMPRHSGTDAFGMQVVAEGIPTMVIGIPLRYMHTPVEVVSLKDIQRVGHLLAEFIARLEPDYVDKIRWDDNPAKDDPAGEEKSK